MGEKWRAEVRGEGRGGFYLQAVVSVCRGLDHHGLGGGAVRSERRSGLCAVM
jgi:hypothetical protein